MAVLPTTFASANAPAVNPAANAPAVNPAANAPAVNPANEPVDIVFDLDQTLLYKTTAAMAAAVPEGVLVIGNEIYRFSDHAIHLVLLAHELPNARVSFFSGGKALRNHAVVQRLYQEIDQLTQAGIYRPYMVLNYDDLSPQELPPSPPGAPAPKFWQRFKKDLARFFNLRSTVIVDDLKGFVPDAQAANMVWIGETFVDRPRFELQALEDPTKGPWSAPDFKAWKLERQKLVPVAAVLTQASQLAQRSHLSFTEAVIKVSPHATYAEGLRALNGPQRRTCKALFTHAG